MKTGLYHQILATRTHKLMCFGVKLGFQIQKNITLCALECLEVNFAIIPHGISHENGFTTSTTYIAGFENHQF